MFFIYYIFYFSYYKDYYIQFQEKVNNFIFHLVIFLTFFIILLMKKEILIRHYTGLFAEYLQNSLFFQLQKKLTKLLNSLGLENKDIILAIS